MAQFFKPKPKPKTSSTLELTIDHLDLHGVGIGRHQGKTIFVEGANASSAWAWRAGG